MLYGNETWCKIYTGTDLLLAANSILFTRLQALPRCPKIHGVGSLIPYSNSSEKIIIATAAHGRLGHAIIADAAHSGSIYESTNYVIQYLVTTPVLRVNYQTLILTFRDVVSIRLIILESVLELWLSGKKQVLLTHRCSHA